MAHPHRRAFTLVELLVVITIITILASIAVPAVMYAIENARQVTCQNNLREITKGLINFETKKQRFPGYTNLVGRPDWPASWCIEALPAIERQDIYDLYLNLNNTVPPVNYVEMFTCPSDPPLDRTRPYLSYVANGGYEVFTANHATAAQAGDKTRESINNGIFHNYYPRVPDLRTRGPAINTSQIADGATNTLLLTENIARYTGNFLEWGAAGILGDQNDKQRTCFVWHMNDSVSPQVRRINGNKYVADLEPAKDGNNAARPSAAHNGGSMASFAGGNVMFLRQDLDYHVYIQLMTPRHSKVTVPNHAALGYVLREGDYR